MSEIRLTPDRAALIAWAKKQAERHKGVAEADRKHGYALGAKNEQLKVAHFDAIAALLEAGQQLERLVGDLQAHAKDAGWQDVDDPIAALLACPLPAPPVTEAP